MLNGLKACKDYEMLIGVDISPVLVEAIEQSRASIVILSPNYVDSVGGRGHWWWVRNTQRR